MNKMNKLLLGAGIFVAASSANAIPISGSIGFSGGYSHNGTSNLSDATQINITSASVTGITSGDFFAAGIVAGTPASYSSFTFAPVGFVDDLWHVGDFVFDLTSMFNEFQSGNFLALSGTGSLSAPGFDTTDGAWGFTANNFGSSFTWSDSNDALPQYDEKEPVCCTDEHTPISVPEPAITLLLGVGLLGFSLSRKMRKAA